MTMAAGTHPLQVKLAPPPQLDRFLGPLVKRAQSGLVGRVLPHIASILSPIGGLIPKLQYIHQNGDVTELHNGRFQTTSAKADMGEYIEMNQLHHGNVGPHGRDNMSPHEGGNVGMQRFHDENMNPHGRDDMSPHGVGNVGMQQSHHGIMSSNNMGPHRRGSMKMQPSWIDPRNMMDNNGFNQFQNGSHQEAFQPRPHQNQNSPAGDHAQSQNTHPQPPHPQWTPHTQATGFANTHLNQGEQQFPGTPSPSHDYNSGNSNPVNGEFHFPGPNPHLSQDQQQFPRPPSPYNSGSSNLGNSEFQLPGPNSQFGINQTPHTSTGTTQTFHTAIVPQNFDPNQQRGEFGFPPPDSFPGFPGK